MDKIIQRDHYLQKLIDRRNNGMVKVITGIRRCGKSFLLFTLFKAYLMENGVREDHIIEVALDEDRFESYRDPAKLSAYVRSRIEDDGQYCVFIDEVQLAISKEELFNPENVRLYGVLNGLLRLKNVDVYVTGSNSKLLTRDVMTVFRGRGDEVKLYPLSFKEYYSFVGGDRSAAYEEYALYGGMPLVLAQKNDADKMNYLRRLFEEVYFRDIIERYSIHLEDVLSELTDVLCSSVGSLTNVTKLERTLKTLRHVDVSGNTVAKYLEYLSDSFLFTRAKRYDVKGRKYFEYPAKYYCTDVGLRNARLNFRQQEETHLMENVIYNELLCRDCAVDVGVVEINESKNGKQQKKQTEIDFVVNRGAKKYYIQSALMIDSEEKMASEIRPLKQTGDFFKKIIVTKTAMKPWIDEDGILHVGLYDFLLDDRVFDF